MPKGSVDGGKPLPSLAEVVTLAKQQSLGVARSEADVAIGRSAYVGARLSSLTNPYLEVFADRGTFGPSNATKDIAIQGNLWLPVEVAGQRGKRVEEVDALVRWKTHSLEASRAQAAGDAVRAYGDVLALTARVRAFETMVASAKAESELYEARLRAGDVTQQDAKLAAVEVVRNSVALAESRAALVRGLGDLARAVGSPTLFLPPPSMAELVLPPPPKQQGLEAYVSHTLAQSPYLTASEKEADYYARSQQRQAVEAHVPLNLIVSAGRGDVGETRLGGGLSWTFPFLRKNQGEQARALSERQRALRERDGRKKAIEATCRGLFAERTVIRAAREEMKNVGEPAAQAAVDATVATLRAGKGELLRVLTSRRDLALLKFRRLELSQREWSIVGDMVALTGEFP